ncbi:MAG TPA: protein-L-isoaspartate(D-aspartate) O-methyltransferase [Alphaproteobacteria bacterium]|nr:protein-L-isoaspartate(D-aspartate) O-methyltransferase [Alphaproteobacteria bacterium]
MATHKDLLEDIRRDFADTASWTGRAAPSPQLMAALAAVDRARFVPPSEIGYAYLNTPLPIGHRQTISQPYIVAIMTDLLDLAPEDTVLEIGTGSGYQAAVLARLARHVYSIEVIPDLAARAAETLQRLGYPNVEVKSGDGRAGWPEKAPFDAVIVTAAAAEIPAALVEQLKPGGRMVIPVGAPDGDQRLTVIEKSASGETRSRVVLPVAFVPLVKG